MFDFDLDETPDFQANDVLKRFKAAPNAVVDYVEIDPVVAAFTSVLSGEEYAELNSPNLFNKTFVLPLDKQFEDMADILERGSRVEVRNFISGDLSMLKEYHDGLQDFGTKLREMRRVRNSYPSQNLASKAAYQGGVDSTASKFTFAHLYDPPDDKLGIFFGNAGSYHHADHLLRLKFCVDTDSVKGYHYYKRGSIFQWRDFLKMPGGLVKVLYSDVAVGDESGMIWSSALNRNYQDIIDGFEGEKVLKLSVLARLKGRIKGVNKVRPHNEEIIVWCDSGPDYMDFSEYISSAEKNNWQRTVDTVTGVVRVELLRMFLFPPSSLLEMQRSHNKRGAPEVKQKKKKKINFSVVTAITAGKDFLHCALFSDMVSCIDLDSPIVLVVPVKEPLVFADYVPSVKMKGPDLFEALYNSCLKFDRQPKFHEVYGWYVD